MARKRSYEKLFICDTFEVLRTFFLSFSALCDNFVFHIRFRNEIKAKTKFWVKETLRIKFEFVDFW